MIYSLSLFQVGLACSLFLIATHSYALLFSHSVRKNALAFPRSQTAGTFLIFIAGLWTFLLVWKMDLGEFARLRSFLLVAVAIGTFLSWRFVEEFLAVRALGILALLAAELLLSAAFLQPQITRLLLVIIAYAWIFLGLLWVGMPYLLRDQLNWISASSTRWKIATITGLIYGAAIFICTLLFYKSP